MIELNLRSGLADAIRALVSEKNALGYPYVQSARHLTAFDAMCAERYPGSHRSPARWQWHGPSGATGSTPTPR